MTSHGALDWTAEETANLFSQIMGHVEMNRFFVIKVALIKASNYPSENLFPRSDVAIIVFFVFEVNNKGTSVWRRLRWVGINEKNLIAAIKRHFYFEWTHCLQHVAMIGSFSFCVCEWRVWALVRLGAILGLLFRQIEHLNSNTRLVEIQCDQMRQFRTIWAIFGDH